jgi:hypothetical protein
MVLSKLYTNITVPIIKTLTTNKNTRKKCVTHNVEMMLALKYAMELSFYNFLRTYLYD